MKIEKIRASKFVGEIKLDFTATLNDGDDPLYVSSYLMREINKVEEESKKEVSGNGNK